MEGGRHASLLAELMRSRSEFCFPPQVRSATTRFASGLLALLFPHFAEEVRCDERSVATELDRLEVELEGLIGSLRERFPEADPGSVKEFLERLPRIHQELMGDAEAIYHGDPAARSIDEVILAYPGFLAVALHRVAHELHLLRVPLLPRLLSSHAHRTTGVDIHPGATIGRSFFIDHGTGIVIGETSVIGNGVKLYQGVTLGALAVAKALADHKRHPTVEDNVVIYANATILGGETVVGHDSIIGGNAWVTESIPAFSVVGRRSDVRPRPAGSGEPLEFNI